MLGAQMADVQKISPFLWFNDSAAEAMAYYITVFPNSRITHVEYYPDESLDEHFRGMSGKIITGIFELAGQRFMCLDGGPVFTLSEAVSFLVSCRDQTEIDYYWAKLSHVTEAEQCGWCKDKFGVSWQIVPENVNEFLKTPRAVQKMMQMKKIDIAGLENV